MKQVEISNLVRWAYRDELPRAHPLDYGRMALGIGFKTGSIWQMGKLGVKVQETSINRFGLAPDLTATREPHPDATVVWRAVQKLTDLNLTLPDDWSPLGDMPGIEEAVPEAIRTAVERLSYPVDGDVAVASYKHAGGLRRAILERPSGERMLREPVSRLVAKYAVLGGHPDWEAEPSVRRWMTNDNGTKRYFRKEIIETENGTTPVEVDGMDHKKRRPYPDAYLRHYWDPDPSLAVEDRMSYEIWWSAMNFLVDELAGTLVDYQPTPLMLPARPWLGEWSAPRILQEVGSIKRKEAA